MALSGIGKSFHDLQTNDHALTGLETGSDHSLLIRGTLSSVFGFLHLFMFAVGANLRCREPKLDVECQEGIS